MRAAFITAWNPFSQNLPDKENNARQDELKANLKKRGLICIDGIGKHPSNNWLGEVSVLVLGLDLEPAKSLTWHYEQQAFGWAEGDGAPSWFSPKMEPLLDTRLTQSSIHPPTICHHGALS